MYEKKQKKGCGFVGIFLLVNIIVFMIIAIYIVIKATSGGM